MQAANSAIAENFSPPDNPVMVNGDAKRLAGGIKQNLIKRAGQLGRPLDALYKKAGISEATVRKWGKTMPTLGKLLDVADAFELTLDQVLGRAPLPGEEAESPAMAPCDHRTMRAAVGTVAAIVKASPAWQRVNQPFITHTDAITAAAYSAYIMWASALKTDPQALSNAAISALIEDKVKAELSNNGQP